MKIGMYTDDEILEHLTDGEGRGFLGRSMYDAIMEELQRKDNIINGIKEELNKNYNTYVCKNKSYGNIFKAGAETYKEHLLYKIKDIENDN